MGADLSRQLRASKGQLALDVLEDRSLRYWIQDDFAPRRQVAEALLQLLDQSGAAGSCECPVAQIEPELQVLLSDEVQDGQHRLRWRPPQAAAQLLEEDGCALCGTKQEQCVHVGEVEALVEEVDGEEQLYFARPQRCGARLALPEPFTGDSNGGNAGAVKRSAM